MRLLYSLIIYAYRLAIGIAGPFNAKAKKWVEGRKDIFQKLEAAIQKDAPLAWFHCASLGEFEQGRPLIEKFRKTNPGYRILITFFSPSGYEIRKNYSGADHVFYLPLDTRANAERFISIVNPKIVFFVKYEFWFNYLDQLHRANIPLFLVSAIFRPDQYFFKSYGGWARRALHKFTHFFVQDESSKQLLNRFDLHNITISGDTRFDRVADVAAHPKDIPVAATFSSGAMVIVAGSTWDTDDQLLTELASKHNGFKLIIAPHEIEEEKIERLVNAFGGPPNALRFSKAASADPTESRVLIIDNIGQLSSIYRYGQIAYIGGGFGKGIHNTLEAAAYGMPVIFGPNYHKFKEAKKLIELGGAFSISNYNQLEQRALALFNDPSLLKSSSEISRSYVMENRGATSIILRETAPFLEIRTTGR